MSDLDDLHDDVMRLIYDAVQDATLRNNRTMERWLLNGMHGRLAKRNGILFIEPCEPEHDGELRVVDYGWDATHDWR